MYPGYPSSLEWSEKQKTKNESKASNKPMSLSAPQPAKHVVGEEARARYKNKYYKE